jgi:hypothetical protein
MAIESEDGNGTMIEVPPTAFNAESISNEKADIKPYAERIAEAQAK